MGTVSENVAITITAESAKVTQEGFGVPLIVSFTAGWTERVRAYNELSEVAVDFATSTAEYKAAARIFGQNPRPPSLLIGRAALKPTMRWAVTPTAVNGYTYRMTVNGQAVSFTADSSATVTEVIAGLKAAIDALALGITTSDQTTHLRILANTAGVFFSVGSMDPNLSIAQDHADPGIATDLAAIALERNDWYGLITTANSKALVDAAAAWAVPAKKLYVAQTQDHAVINTISSGTDDVGESQASAANDVALIFSPTTDDFADAGAMGRLFPYEPGTETWKFKTLTGVPATTFTATQRTNMRAKKVNFYEATAGVNMLEEGYCSSGKFIDLVRWLHAIESRLGTDVFGAQASAIKIPYTDRGFETIAGKIRGRLQLEEQAGAIDAGWEVIVPTAAGQTSANRSARHATGFKFNATYAGAIHKVSIAGSVIA